MNALPPYRTRIDPQWIDYNGHLRDAFYGVIMSLAIDDVMDHLGLDAAYRQRSGCTLYTLESHMHYLHEVKSTDELEVTSSILACDRKRIHLGCRFDGARVSEAVAMGDAMLLHVRQGTMPASAAFPAEVELALESLKLPQASADAWTPRSRKIELHRR